MDRTERLVDLIAFLLDAREPVPFSSIQQAFPDDYDPDAHDASIRKFERDKADLVELGIPIRWAEGDDDRDAGYVVDKGRLYLPAIDLTPEETAVLFLAGSAALSQDEFPYRHDLNLAIQKTALRAGAKGDQPTPRVVLHHPAIDGGPELRDCLAALQRALAACKEVRFTYHGRVSGETARRRVDPYGLFFRHGRWSLVGHSHERAALRVFSVHRMQGLEVNEAKPRSPDFEVPASFDLRDHVGLPAWRFDSHDPVTVLIDVRLQFRWLAEQDLGVSAVPHDADFARLEVEAANTDAIVDWALAMGDKVRVVSPEDVRARVRASFEAILARHGGAA